MLRAFKTPPKGLGDKSVKEFDGYCEQVENFVRTNRPGTPLPSPLEVLLSLSSTGEPGWGSGGPLARDYISTRPLKLFIAFSKQMKTLYDIAHALPLEGVLSHVVNEFNLLEYLDKVSKTKGEFEERKSNVVSCLRKLLPEAD